jgi:hypothetical protein
LDDGGSGKLYASLALGQELKFVSAIGQRYFFTKSGTSSKGPRSMTPSLGGITVVANRALYLLEDKSFNVPADIAKLVSMEQRLQRSYQSQQGMPWVESFELEGPRPPPIFLIKPMHQVSDTEVVTVEGSW